MAVLAFSALQADVASALGLGSVSVRSTLNQPLNAEIRLLDIGDLDASQIKIELASNADFERAGVERDYFLSNLRFAVELDGRGGGVVRISTREPVVEPYLNFILETRWPSGRLLREYAVLLDLPTFSEGASVPFVPAGSSGLATVQQQSRSTPAPAPAPAAQPAGDWSMPGAGPGEYRVQQNDTMGKIAARLRPAGDISVEQTMLAIQRANPQAFIRDNVNLVKAGYILRVPSADEMRSLSASEASQEVLAQTQAWRGGEGHSSGTAAGASAPQLDARASAAATDEGGYREQARLSIATPGDSKRAAPGEGAAASGAGTEALRNELASAQEGLESARRDNSELQSRLDDMERQVATLNRLISLKDEQLAALQQQGQQQIAAATGSPADDAAPATDEIAASETAAPDAAAAPETAAPPPAPPPAAKPAAPVAPAPAAKPGLIEQLTANPLVPAAGLGALALLIGGVVLARRRKAAVELPRFDYSTAFDRIETEPAEEPVTADLDDALISDDKVASADDFARAEAEAEAEAPARVRSETGDAIAEAEIYIAYGRYQQAVDLLKSAVEAEPLRTDLRIKLLEVYLEMRDRDAFRRQFAELQALGDEGAVAQVKEILSSVDGVSGWLDDLPTVSAPAVAAVAAASAAGLALADEPAGQGADEPAFESELELDQELVLDQELALDDSLTGGELDLDIGDDLAVDADLSLNALTQADEIAQAIDQPAPSLNDLSGLTPFEPPLQRVDEVVASEEETFELPADAAADEGLELDLSEEELDLALDDIGAEGEGLEDLALDFAAEQPAQEVSVALDDEFDLAAFDTPAPGESESPLELAGELEEPQAPAEAESVADALADLSTELPADLGSFDDLDLELDSGAVEQPAVVEPEPFAAPEPSFDSVAESLPADEFTIGEEFTAEAVDAQAAAEVPVLEGGDDEFDFLADADEVATKLDLARAYIDMGDTDGARDILGEVMQEGTEAQRQDASALLSRIG